MAVNKTSKHTHEWMALVLWLGLMLVTLATSIYILTNLNLPAQIMAQSSNSFGQVNPLTGEPGGATSAKVALYLIVLLFVGTIYFLVSAWLKLGSMLLEVVIHNSREEGGKGDEPIFSMFLYLSRTKRSGDGFDPDDAEGSMPGEILRNIAYAWVTAFLIFGLSVALLYLL